VLRLGRSDGSELSVVAQPRAGGGVTRGRGTPRQGRGTATRARRRGTRGRGSSPAGGLGAGAVDPAAFVAWQGELGLEKGAQGGNVQDGVVRLGRRNALPSTLLLFDFSGLLCFVYKRRCMEKLTDSMGLRSWVLALVCVVN